MIQNISEDILIENITTKIAKGTREDKVKYINILSSKVNINPEVLKRGNQCFLNEILEDCFQSDNDDLAFNSLHLLNIMMNHSKE